MEGRQRGDWDDLLFKTGSKSDSGAKGNKYSLRGLMATASNPNSTAASVAGV